MDDLPIMPCCRTQRYRILGRCWHELSEHPWSGKADDGLCSARSRRRWQSWRSPHPWSGPSAARCRALLSGARLTSLAICTGEITPSACGLPDDYNEQRNALVGCALGSLRDLSPTTTPMLPPMKLKSMTTSMSGRSSMRPRPATQPSLSFGADTARTELVAVRLGSAQKLRGSEDCMSAPNSSKLPGSSSSSRRSFALRRK